MSVSNEEVDFLLDKFELHAKIQSSETAKKRIKRYRSSLVVFDSLKKNRDNIISLGKKIVLVKGSLTSTSDIDSFKYDNCRLETFPCNAGLAANRCCIVTARKAYEYLFNTANYIYDCVEVVATLEVNQYNREVWKYSPTCPNLFLFKHVSLPSIKKLYSIVGKNNLPFWLQNYLILE